MARGNGMRADLRALGAAAIVHALIAASLLAIRAPARPPPSAGGPEPALTRTQQTEEAEIDVTAPVASEDLATSEAALSVPPRIATAVVPERPRDEPPAPPTPSGETTSAEPAPSGTPPTLMTGPTLDLGLHAKNPFLARGALPELGDDRDYGPRRAPPTSARPEAPTPEEAKRANETALRAPAREREQALGLGPEGPVLTALGEATYASATAVKGHAVFLAVADANGFVVGLDVLSCDGGRDAWARTAAAALAELKGRKLRLPSTAKRAEMRVEVTADWKLPSGHDPGADVDVFHIPLKKGEGKQSTKVSILDPIPKLRVDQLEIAPGVKVPIVSISADILSVHGDPADIGAKPRRSVHTRLVDTKFL